MIIRLKGLKNTESKKVVNISNVDDFDEYDENTEFILDEKTGIHSKYQKQTAETEAAKP